MYIIYTKHDCPWCDKAKSLLENLGHQYEEKHFNVDFTKEDLVAMLPETIRPTVPQIYLKGNRIGGYEDLKAHLKITDK
jgi:glutaredoxin 3